MSHKNDPELIKRLRRAEGHLAGVVRMVSEDRDALAVAQQLQAVIRALEKSKQMLIHDHIDHHLVDISSPRSAETERLLTQVRELTKYL